MWWVFCFVFLSHCDWWGGIEVVFCFVLLLFFFPGESDPEWTDAASLVNTRNGCHWTEAAIRGSFLDQILVGPMIKNKKKTLLLPALSLSHIYKLLRCAGKIYLFVCLFARSQLSDTNPQANLAPLIFGLWSPLAGWQSPVNRACSSSIHQA